MDEASESIINFGIYRGVAWTLVPLSYLHRLANQDCKGKPAWERNLALAMREIDRRGPSFPKVEITPYAFDAASLNVPLQWKDDRYHNEGLFSWLRRITLEALEIAKGSIDTELEPGDELTIPHKGVALVVEIGRLTPVLKTVLREST